MTVAGPKGDTEWERTIDYINFGEQCWAAGGVWGLQMCVQLLLRGWGGLQVPVWRLWLCWTCSLGCIAHTSMSLRTTDRINIRAPY